MKNYKITIKTDHPVAYDSEDHIHPAGTKNDNFTNQALVNEVENDLCRDNNPLKLIDLGCAGGLFVHDFIRKGHIAVGLEGSNFNVIHKRAEWPELYEKNLFTCDITRDYSLFIESDNKTSLFQCDLITAWEVVEHIPPDRLTIFFDLIRRHLKIGGRFIAGISLCEGPPHHVAMFPIPHWKTKILNQLHGLELQEYPYLNVARPSFTSLYIALKRTA
jgi:hypothetical protein